MLLAQISLLQNNWSFGLRNKHTCFAVTLVLISVLKIRKKFKLDLFSNFYTLKEQITTNWLSFSNFKLNNQNLQLSDPLSVKNLIGGSSFIFILKLMEASFKYSYYKVYLIFILIDE